MLVVLGGLLDEFVVEPAGFFHFLRGDGQLFGLAAGGRIAVHRHLEQVDDRVEAVARLDGILHQGDRLAESLLRLADGFVEVGFLVIEVVDGEQDRFLEFST